MLDLSLSNLEINALFLEVQLLFELKTLGFLFSHELFILIFIILQSKLMFVL